MSSGRLCSLARVALSLVLVWALSTPLFAAGSLASWGGRVFQPDRATPRAGIVVRLIDEAGERGPQSDPTRPDGGFMIDDAPVGTYSLQVETPEGVFVSSQPVHLEAGTNAPMALQLHSQPINAKQEFGMGEGDVSRRTEWIIAGAVTAVALLVYLQITEDDDEEPGSLD